MGWSITITSNKAISIEEAKDIFSSLPVELKGSWDEFRYGTGRNR